MSTVLDDFLLYQLRLVDIRNLFDGLEITWTMPFAEQKDRKTLFRFSKNFVKNSQNTHQKD
ncbi:hypothetical protein CAEBREN_32111 [Caenorhabditis brenneri]|uniref:Uncharacterized protein n=1 Tax=Caenorhabditis brenneri TaxID=135651 RepID=G0NAJ1_CAEBE|nr:hypothetical protein CAEBREN_32111 [Caenorhabditis brenneri]